MSIQKLHYENLGGMLIRREGLLNWRCPLCKAEGQSPEVMRACPECGSKEATLPGAQPAPSEPSFADAYQGAMEEVAIWKKRALEAEDLNREFITEINGPTYMGEPAQNVPDDILRDAKRYRFLRAAKNIPISSKAARDPVVYDEAIDAAMLAAAPEAKPCP